MNAERLLAHFDRLADAPDAVPRLRRFVLDLAVRGRLVAQDPTDELAWLMLDRLEAEKAKLLAERTIRKNDGLEPIVAGELPFSLPEGWVAARMGDIAVKLGAGSTPLGGKTAYRAEGVPFLRSQNVHDDGLRLDDVALIPRETHEKMSGTHIRCGDLLLNITGASIGRCAIVPDTFIEGNVSQHVTIVRLIDPALREFVHLAMIAPPYQQMIDDAEVGVSREGLSMQRLKQFPMVLPPLAEQRRIVAKVDELMALCDALESRLTTARQTARRLLDAVLHEALGAAITAPGSDAAAHENTL